MSDSTATIRLARIDKNWWLFEGETLIAKFVDGKQAARFCKLFHMAGAPTPDARVKLVLHLPQTIIDEFGIPTEERTQ